MAALLMHASSHLLFDPRGHLIHQWNKIFLSALPAVAFGA
jgi:hypothetical protein